MDRISDERLAEIAGAIDYRSNTTAVMMSGEARSILTELQRRRAEARQAPLPAGTVTEEMVERATDELLAHGEFSTIPAQNRPNAKIAARTILEAAFAARPAEREPVVSKDVVLADLPNMVRRVRKNWPAMPEDVVRDMLLVAMCCESCVSVATYWREKAESRPAEPVAEDGSDKAAIEIADAVIAWMVRNDLLDAELEYRDDDIVEALDALISTPAPGLVEALEALKAIGAPDLVDLVSLPEPVVRGMLNAAVSVAQEALASITETGGAK